MKKIAILVVGLMLVAAACNKPVSTTDNKQLDNPSNDNRTFVVQLKEQNSSKQNGVARLKADNGKVRVNVQLSNAPKDTPQPSHIHLGSCAAIGEVKYPLTSLVNGKSETTIDTTLDALVSALPLALNVHKSATEATSYVACGDITPTEEDEADTDNDDDQADEVRSGETQVVMTANNFAPASITIKKGTKVTFKNNSSKVIWPASAPHPTHTDYPEFDSQKGIAAGESWSFTFSKVGTWRYHDHLNPTMFGSITVK